MAYQEKSPEPYVSQMSLDDAYVAAPKMEEAEKAVTPKIAPKVQDSKGSDLTANPNIGNPKGAKEDDETENTDAEAEKQREMREEARQEFEGRLFEDDNERDGYAAQSGEAFINRSAEILEFIKSHRSENRNIPQWNAELSVALGLVEEENSGNTTSEEQMIVAGLQHFLKVESVKNEATPLFEGRGVNDRVDGCAGPYLVKAMETFLKELGLTSQPGDETKTGEDTGDKMKAQVDNLFESDEERKEYVETSGKALEAHTGEVCAYINTHQSLSQDTEKWNADLCVSLGIDDKDSEPIHTLNRKLVVGLQQYLKEQSSAQGRTPFYQGGDKNGQIDGRAGPYLLKALDTYLVETGKIPKSELLSSTPDANQPQANNRVSARPEPIPKNISILLGQVSPSNQLRQYADLSYNSLQKDFRNLNEWGRNPHDMALDYFYKRFKNAKPSLSELQANPITLFDSPNSWPRRVFSEYTKAYDFAKGDKLLDNNLRFAFDRLGTVIQDYHSLSVLLLDRLDQRYQEKISKALATYDLPVDYSFQNGLDPDLKTKKSSLLDVVFSRSPYDIRRNPAYSSLEDTIQGGLKEPQQIKAFFGNFFDDTPPTHFYRTPDELKKDLKNPDVMELKNLFGVNSEERVLKKVNTLIQLSNMHQLHGVRENLRSEYAKDLRKGVELLNESYEDYYNIPRENPVIQNENAIAKILTRIDTTSA